jgi:hypothetical protein
MNGKKMGKVWIKEGETVEGLGMTGNPAMKWAFKKYVNPSVRKF